MTFETTPIDGLLVITPKVFEDARGYFMESFRQDALEAFMGPVNFVQENESFSVYGVTRGLHFQKAPHAQAKLIRAVTGAIFDVAVDIRPQSSTYGKYFAVQLSGENKKQFFIPRGFAHGFCVLSPTAVVQYKTDAVYCPAAEGSFRYDSPDLDIPWPVAENERILSAKDKAAPIFIL